MKPNLSNVTLISVDCTDKVQWTVRAMERCLEQCEFADVKLLTSSEKVNSTDGRVKIKPIKSLEEYSKFCIRDLHRYVDTKYCLLVQSDGFVLNGTAWTNEFYNYDFGGAPFQPSNTVGNGGFSWRSKKLLEACAELPEGSDHPEDSAICVRHRQELEAKGLKFMPVEIARQFSFEGRSWNTKEWQGVPNQWRGQFGFHSLLSVLPNDKKPFKIFHHSLDQGDCIYGLAAMKALGGGALFISPDNKFPYPLASRWQRMGGEADTVDNLRPLIEAQDYVVSCRYTHGTPFSTDYDLNRFRIPWRNRTVRDFDSILSLHMDAFHLPMPTEPWLIVNDPIKVDGRPIVVARTSRYQNDAFPWDRLCAKYGDQMVFVGTTQEASVFQGFAPEKKVPHCPTKDALELARVIAGAKLCIMNQSLPLAIAHGLHKKVLVETWPQNSNCVIPRDGAMYEVPKVWL